MDYRLEHDSLGEHKVPNTAYYGVQTLRALENFDISGIPIFRFERMIQSLAEVKKAACLANMELDLLPDSIGEVIVQACRDVRSGMLDSQFVVDVVQGGAGTSVNMNANEVICNRALEIAGHNKGDYHVIHPLNHVNLSQSTNDVYPTAFRIALVRYIDDLIRAIRELREGLDAKGVEFARVIKMARTQLQDAVPITLGAEFAAWGVTVGEDIQRLEEMRLLLCEVNMGATAVGTGINSVVGYADLVVEKLADITGLPIRRAENLIEATSDAGAYVMLSGMLKRISVKISKICNDLRLLSSGPFTGLREINLPPVQPGSSIMPGKVNPVIPEMVNQVAYQVVGNDMTVTMAAESGQLQLNVFLPIIAFNLFQGLEMLSRAFVTLRRRCIDGITANPERCLQLVKGSLGVVTALAPVIGYEEAASLVKQAQESGKDVCGIVRESGLPNAEDICSLLDPEMMLAPRERMKK
ncbi:aspartate ammonia-lyase [Desulfovibrio mangrovi]|uniref:aspartate ammonia-lyase n=1 Tax=Desulfovibrio mangrovi TaxID=2976983 RepID=UPI0022467ECD|nr:aspartate ammonia-lyase [Desulfovibrio mangrovi]UZP68090.1 aspartate ammonia-lyase [Desulfovibrio mangrovi]